jgi:Phosphotransferase enzyme family
MVSKLRRALDELVALRFEGARIVEVVPFGTDEGSEDNTDKAFGYGKPIRITLVAKDGRREQVVMHAAASGDFGHERRSDRAGEMLLAFDSFGDIPSHVRPIDVGAVTDDGHFVSLRDADELYLLTSYAPGTLYADELRAIATRGEANDKDRAHAERLASYLAELHQPIRAASSLYTRAIRDLVGHGEGIFGIIDGYPADEPAAPPEKLQAIERACVDWRWRLKDRHARLARTHGDFHPFNVLFDGDTIALLDTSRGSMGDPADDLAAMAINYPFFALQHPGSWARGFQPLWQILWRRYLELRPDAELLEVVPPFLAWRLLVVANPRWYPQLDTHVRRKLIGFAESVLAADRFRPDDVEALLS